MSKKPTLPLPREADIQRARSSLFHIYLVGHVLSQANARGHWSKRHRYAKDWRRVTALLTAEAMRKNAPVWSNPPKHITFIADVWSLMDDDNLESALKPIRDGLQDAQLILDDGPSSGNRFSYEQRVNRKQPRVIIRVEIL